MTAKLVLDCSVTICWFVADEATDYTRNILIRMIDGMEAIVPSIWELEVSNILLSKIRRRHASFSQAIEFMHRLSDLSISASPHFEGRVFESISPLAHDHNLTSYDAAYLHLAWSEGLPIATLDKNLRTAAKQLGVEIF